METKNEVRIWALQRRRALTGKAERSAFIIAALETMPEWASSGKLFVFVSTGDEVDTHPLIRRELLAGCRNVYVPRVTGAGTMDAVRLNSWDELRSGQYGILEPPAGNQVISPDGLDLILVPGLAFTQCGKRLGRGGGFYDRYLARAVNALFVGLTYRDLIVAAMPVTDTDIACHHVITETGATTCN